MYYMYRPSEQNKSKAPLGVRPHRNCDWRSFEMFYFKVVCAFSDSPFVSVFVKLQNESHKNASETQALAAPSPPPAEEPVEIKNAPEVAVST